MAARAVAYTPRVMPDPPDGLLLDITGCAHLFGREAALAAALAGELHRAMGVSARHALANTAAGARALVRYHVGPITEEAAALRALPVAALGLDVEATRTLHRAGLNRLGDLLVRPAAALAARFGAEAVTALRRLTGEEQAPLDPLPQPAPLRFEQRFAEPVAHQVVIAGHFRLLLERAARALEERGLGARRFMLVLHRSDGARHRLKIETGRPTRDPAVVLRLFDERIESLADPLDPGFGYDSMVLFLAVTEPLAVRQEMLGDAAAADEDTLAALIDRLSTRLGAGSLCRLVPRDSHVPERSQRMLPALHHPASPPWPAAPAGQAPRPLLLLDPPQVVMAMAEVPDGPPQRFRWRGQVHDVALCEGPERIAAEWWRQWQGHVPGGAVPTRDYYRVEDSAGRRFWLFRHGLFEERGDPQWYLHGLFA